MSKFTLSDRLRDIADKIEKLPEEVDVTVEIHCHSYDSAECVIESLKIAEGCESELVHYGRSHWVRFKKMHGEPIELDVFYRPEVMEGVTA